LRVGKTTIMKGSLSVLPQNHYKEIVRATDAAFEYASEELKHKVIAFMQMPAEQSKSDTIHVLTSEGELRILITVRDEETGTRRTVEKKAEGPLVLLGAIVNEKLVRIDEQMKTRTLFIFPNPSPTQTVEIIRRKKQQRRMFYLNSIYEEQLHEFREWYESFFCGGHK